MKFYTTINTIVLFNKIFRLLQLFLCDLIHWNGPKNGKNLAKSGEGEDVNPLRN